MDAVKARLAVNTKLDIIEYPMHMVRLVCKL